MTFKHEVQFYDSFHKHIKVQTKIITKYNFTYILAIKIIEETLECYLDKERRIDILDYGSGAGTLDFYFANKGYYVTGLDISPTAVRLSRTSGKKLHLEKYIKFYTSKHSNTKLRGKKFDIALCLEVIEHVHNDIELIRFLISHLNHGGYLIISTPSINAPLYRMGLVSAFDKNVGHLRRYDAFTLRRVLSDIPEVENVIILKTEGILRNTLFVVKPFSYLIRFIKGPLSVLITLIDHLSLLLFGESNIYLIIRKK